MRTLVSSNKNSIPQVDCDDLSPTYDSKSKTALRQDESVFQDGIRQTSSRKTTPVTSLLNTIRQAKLPFGKTNVCSKMVFDRNSTVGGPCQVLTELRQHLTQPLTSHLLPSLAVYATRISWPDSQDLVEHASS